MKSSLRKTIQKKIVIEACKDPLLEELILDPSFLGLLLPRANTGKKQMLQPKIEKLFLRGNGIKEKLKRQINRFTSKNSKDHQLNLNFLLLLSTSITATMKEMKEALFSIISRLLAFLSPLLKKLHSDSTH
jgi:hypothetical protein